MTDFLTKILGDKKDWKAMEARAKVLPRDYRIVYGEMQSSQGKSILDVIGEDVAVFCHERLRGTTSYLDTWRASLNRDVANKFAG